MEQLFSKRKSYSCTQCRQRRVRCSRDRQCNHCTRRGETCIWAMNASPLPSPPPHPYRANPAPPPPVASTSKTPTPSYPTSLSLSNSLSPATTIVSSATSPQSPESNNQDVKTHEAFDHSILFGPLGAAGHTKRSSVGAKAVNRNTRPRSNFPFGSRDAAADPAALLLALPDQAHCDALVTLYLDRVEWIHHPLHVPTFLAQYNAFWAMPPDQRPTAVEPKWLALLYIILVLGVHFGEPPLSPDKVGSMAEEEDVLYEGCETALAASDFLANHSIEAVQTIVCLGLYLNNVDKSPVAQMTLGIGIKMAIAMGLSRLGAEPSEPTAGLIQRELGRRLWWSLVGQDTYTASNCNCTYQINLVHSTCPLFGNCEDEELVEGSPLPSHDVATHPTASAYHIVKIPFALATRSFIDLINTTVGPPPYDQILALDQTYRSIYTSLPSYLRPDLPQPLVTSGGRRHQLVWERIFNGITLQNRLMRLHRSFMARGYSDPTYRFSTDACLAASYECLELVKIGRVSAFPGARWWVVLVHIWTAGLIISGDLLRDTSADVESKRDGVELAISLLSVAKSTSPAAQRACDILHGLLDQDRANREAFSTTSQPTDSTARQSPPPVSGADPTFDLSQGTAFDFEKFFDWSFTGPQLHPSSGLWDPFANSAPGLEAFAADNFGLALQR